MVLRLLLVEDSEADIKITLRAFGQAQMKNEIFVARDGQECLDFIRHEGAFQDQEKCPRPHLILLDINMPRCDGFEVLRVLKNDRAYRSIPVIMFSASSNEEDIVKSYALGANSFIQKPVDYREFVGLIKSFNHYWQVLNRLPKTLS